MTKYVVKITDLDENSIFYIKNMQYEDDDLYTEYDKIEDALFYDNLKDAKSEGLFVKDSFTNNEDNVEVSVCELDIKVKKEIKL